MRLKLSHLMGIMIPFLALPASVFAHSAELGTGFVSGLYHPVLGPDHLLAMLAVGIISAQIGGKAIWIIPVNFVLFMIFGALAGVYSVSVPMVESGVSLSVVVLGIAIAADRKLPVFFTLIFVGFFGFFHGHAHGTEIPRTAAPAFFGAGFVVGTSAIHLVGVLVGLMPKRFKKSLPILRLGGAVISCFGIAFLGLTG